MGTCRQCGQEIKREVHRVPLDVVAIVECASEEGAVQIALDAVWTALTKIPGISEVTHSGIVDPPRLGDLREDLGRLRAEEE